MKEQDYKAYFSSAFQGMLDFVKRIINPIATLSNPGTEHKLDYASKAEYQDKCRAANIKSIFDFGTYFIDSASVAVFEVVLQDNCNIGRARKNIQTVIRQLLGIYSGAIIVFHYANTSSCADKDTWRLSWVMKEDTQTHSTSAKRYTYLCGPDYSCRTIAQRFEVLQNEPNKTLATISTAFDVEALSKEFFKEYKVIYDDIVQWITGQRIVKVGGKNKKWETRGTLETGRGNDIYKAFYNEFDKDDEKATKAIRDYVKKLLGRLVFIQFLQKKGWLKIDGVASSNFLLDLFNKVGEDYQNDFIESVLEKVVYLLLNNENRLPGSDKVDELTLDVPFLNGGLFEPDACDDIIVQLPKEFFHNEAYKDVKREQNEIRLRDKDKFFTQCGILDLFYQYNFTIDENDPNDAEVGVDPEMLGKIFENLLEDNKEKGAFYTPKEIVQYMCNESLIAYLQTKVPNHDDEIRQFVLDTEKSDVPESKKILNAIKEVKICDPAIGSGAFPMGLLNLLVSLREKLEGTENSRCDMKKEIICNNIYGVDIEKGAIDIARLRFWLSIMVDENTPTPLPNFDYKFMQGNSLLTTFDLQYVDIKQAKQNVEITKKINDKKKELLAKKNEFYGLSGEEKYKKELEVKLLIVEILKLRLGFEKVSVEQQDTTRQMELFAAPDMQQNSRSKKKIQEVKAAQERVQLLIEKLLEIEKQLKDTSRSWEERAKTDILFFDWEMCFSEVFPQGFDIVIGNPPYFVYEGNNKDELPAIREQKEYEIAFGGKLNAYKLFLASSLNNLVKQDGINCYIFQNSFMADLQAVNLRRHVLDNCQILTIDSYPERDNRRKRVFESVKMSVCILLVKNTNTDLSFIVNIWDDKDKSSGITTKFTKNEIKTIDPSYLTIPRLSEEAKPIIIKMINHRCISINCYEGELNVSSHRPFFSDDASLPEIMKGAGIQKYYYTFDMSQGEIEYLKEKEYLNRCGNSEKAYHHSSSRIVMQGMTGANDTIRLIMCIVPEGMYLGHSCKYIMPSDEISQKCLLGFMNSKLANFFFRCFSTNSNVNGYEIEAIPICEIPTNCCEIIEASVEETMRLKSKDHSADISEKEKTIDILVYLLYGLTYDEVMVVENASQGEKLNLDKATYDKWLELYTENGALPSEEEMEKAVK